VAVGRPRSADAGTVLVTGASGFLGRRVVAALRERGLRVRAMVRSSPLPAGFEDVETVDAMLGDDAGVAQAVAGVRAVVHCAARVARRGSRAEFFRDNVGGTGHLLEAARAAGVERFVHVSSIAVYDRQPGNGPVGEGVDYEPHPERRGAYTWSKVEADRLVCEIGARNGMRTVILRPGILVGPEGPEFTARLCLGTVGGRALIVGRGDARLPLCHVDDVARAAALAVSAPAAAGAYNVVDDEPTQDEWLRARAAGGWRLRPLYVPPRLAAIPALALEGVARLARRQSPLSRYKIRRATESLRYDTTRARRDLGWRPETGVRGRGNGAPETPLAARTERAPQAAPLAERGVQGGAS
jgi:nucleoside-diphosphate-sugar epimerase